MWKSPVCVKYQFHPTVFPLQPENPPPLHVGATCVSNRRYDFSSRVPSSPARYLISAPGESKMHRGCFVRPFNGAKCGRACFTEAEERDGRCLEPSKQAAVGFQK